jgi:hypothetical protein
MFGPVISMNGRRKEEGEEEEETKEEGFNTQTDMREVRVKGYERVNCELFFFDHI